MIKARNEYSAPFDIEYDILQKLDNAIVDGIKVTIESTISGEGGNCNCGNNTETLEVLQAIKEAIENKECTNTETIIEKPYIIEKETVIEKPVEKIIYKDKILYKDKIVEKPVVKQTIIYKYIKDNKVVNTETITHNVTSGNSCVCCKNNEKRIIVPKEEIEKKKQWEKDMVKRYTENHKPKQPETLKYLVIYGQGNEPSTIDTKHYCKLNNGKYARIR